MESFRLQYNTIVVSLQCNSEIPSCTFGNDILSILSAIPSSIHKINFKQESLASTSTRPLFEQELLDSASEVFLDKCLDLLSESSTDEYAQFIIYRLHTIYDSKLDNMTTSQTYLNALCNFLKHPHIGYGYIPSKHEQLKHHLAQEPYHHVKRYVVEQLQNKVDLGIKTHRFTPIADKDKENDYLIDWNVFVASNLFTTIKFITFIDITGISERQLLKSVCKLALEKKIIVEIDQIGKFLKFPLRKVDIQHEVNEFFQTHLPNALERDWDLLIR